MAIASLFAVKSYLDIQSPDEDGRIVAILAAVESQVVKHLGYNPERSSHFERMNGNGQQFIVPTVGFPLASVDSLVIDGVTIPAEGAAPGYYVDEGVLRLSGSYRFTKGFGNVKLSYQAGFSPVPDAIKQAVIEMTALRLKEIERIGVSSKWLAGESVSYALTQMPESAKGYLEPFRKVF